MVMRRRRRSRAFGVPLVTVKRYVKLHREAGVAAFFAPVKKRSASKLTREVCQQAQEYWTRDWKLLRSVDS